MAGCAARAPPGSEARLSLAAFLLGASVLALPLLTRAGLQGRTALALYVAGLNALLLLLYRPPRYQVRAGAGAGPGAGGRDARHPPGGRAGGRPPGAGPRRGAPSPERSVAGVTRWQRGPRLPGLRGVGPGPPPGGAGAELQLVRFSSCGRCAWGEQ